MPDRRTAGPDRAAVAPMRRTAGRPTYNVCGSSIRCGAWLQEDLSHGEAAKVASPSSGPFTVRVEPGIGDVPPSRTERPTFRVALPRSTRGKNLANRWSGHSPAGVWTCRGQLPAISLASKAIGGIRRARQCCCRVSLVGAASPAPRLAYQHGRCQRAAKRGKAVR